MDKGTVRTNLTTRANGLKAAKSEGLQYVFVSFLTTEWLHHTIQSEILADYGCSLKVIHMPSELKSWMFMEFADAYEQQPWSTWYQ